MWFKKGRKTGKAGNPSKGITGPVIKALGRKRRFTRTFFFFWEMRM